MGVFDTFTGQNQHAADPFTYGGISNPDVNHGAGADPNLDPRIRDSYYHGNEHAAYGYYGPSEQSAAFNSGIANQQGQQFLRDSYAQQQGAYGGLNGLGAVAQDYRNYLTGASGPSRAQLLAQQMESQTAANAMGLAASQRGGASAGGTRAAIMAGNQAALQSGAQIGQLRAQEQETARQGMLGAYGAQAQGYAGLRNQTLGAYGNAGQQAQGWYGSALGAEDQRAKNQNAGDQIGLDAYKAQQGLYEGNAQRGAWGGLGTFGSDQRIKDHITPLGTFREDDDNGGIYTSMSDSAPSSPSSGSAATPTSAAKPANDPNAKSSWDNLTDSTGQVFNKGGGIGKAKAVGGLISNIIGMFSDERVKKNITPETRKDDELEMLLSSIRPVAFNYKPGVEGPGYPGGRHVGLLAQDLERTPAGAAMVADTPKGKVVDTGQAALAALAAAADLNKRVKAVEGRRR